MSTAIVGVIMNESHFNAKKAGREAEGRHGRLVKNFAKNLRRYREINDLTQEEVARITGAQTSHISRLESGYRSVGLDYLEEFCDALGVDPLLMLTEDPEDTMILAGKRIRKWLT